MLSGDNGILQKATDAKAGTTVGQEKETVALAYNSALAKKASNGNTSAVTDSELNDELDSSEATASGSPIIVTFSKTGNAYEIDSQGVINPSTPQNPEIQTLPTALGTKPYFPSNKFKQLEGTNLTNGLVITDKAENEEIGNEYVWIEVPSTVVDSTATGGPDYSGVSGATDYGNIATALRNFCTKDASNASLIIIGTSSENYGKTTLGWKDEYYEGCGIADSGDYDNLYHAMLKSIYENGGFWRGRYEAGTGVARQNGDSASGITPLSKKDQYPINYVTCSEAQTIARNTANKGTYNSSLMFGIQWDLVLRHLSNKGVSTNLLTENSETWGNYNLDYDLNQSSAHGFKGDFSTSEYKLIWSTIESEYSHMSANWSTTFTTALSTGATTRNMQKNIYDLAGNMYEWTLEKSTAQFPSAMRGGYYRIYRI